MPPLYKIVVGNARKPFQIDIPKGTAHIRAKLYVDENPGVDLVKVLPMVQGEGDPLWTFTRADLKRYKSLPPGTMIIYSGHSGHPDPILAGPSKHGVYMLGIGWSIGWWNIHEITGHRDLTRQEEIIRNTLISGAQWEVKDAD